MAVPTGRRRAEAVDGDDVVGVALPAEARARFDRELRHARRQHRIAVRRRLAPRTAPTTGTTRHAPRARRRRAASRAATHSETSDPVPMSTRSRRRRLSSTSTYAPRGQPFGAALRGAREHGHALAGRARSRWGPSPSMWNRHACANSLASAGRMTSQLRHRAQRRELLDRLVGGAVLADADRVVRPHERGLVAARARRGAPRDACSR